MRTRIPRWSVLPGTLAVFPSVAAAQPIDPSAAAGWHPGLQAIASLLAVGLVGTGLLLAKGRFVDRAVESTADRLPVAIAYGVIAYVLVLFFAMFASDLLIRLGVAGTTLSYATLAIIGGGAVLLGGLGYLVVGTLLTDVLVGHRPWQGLLVGAALSAVGWIALPTVPALVAWLLVPAVGIGGPMRKWVHRERTVETEASTR